MIYRAALDQPNQEDFIEIIAHSGEAICVLLRPFVLDLSGMDTSGTRTSRPGLSQCYRLPLLLDQMR
jgi:hypothetical protein